MSAIAGLINLNKEPISSEHTIKLMDGFKQFPAHTIDTWKMENVFLGCHAQWITPESINEPLPYYDYKRNLAITADAIIDNRIELFEKLNINSKSLQNNTPDSQIVLLAYSKWGEDCTKYLIGDFAFMLWDGNKQKLFGARDFSGGRTLYYHSSNNLFAFATTIKPLFTLPYIDKTLNEEWIAEFLAISSIVEATNQRSTVYNSISQLPPSHSISVENGEVRLTRYSVIETDQRIRFKSDEDYIDAFHEVFSRAVKDRIRTYGDIGSHLSGGLDSGSVVSFASRELCKANKMIHTFSYVPTNKFVDWTPSYYEADESQFIKETVKHVGNINDQYLSLEGKSPLTEIDEMLDIMEMPYKFFGNSFWLKGIFEAGNKQGVKIMLNGARGNHSISWGPQKVSFEYYSSLLKTFRWRKLFKEMDLYCQNYKTGKTVLLPQIINVNTNKGEFKNLDTFISPLFAAQTNVIEKLKNNEFFKVFKTLSEYRRHYYNRLYSWNQPSTATAKMSLNYGVCDRDPTNDIRVINFCLSLPEEQFAKAGMERSFIRRATKGYLPDKVRLNYRSRGLQGADTIHRMDESWTEFKSELIQMTVDPIINNYLDTKKIQNIVTQYSDKPSPNIIFSMNFKYLTRCLILYRFIKKIELKGGERNEERMEITNVRNVGY